MLTSLRRRPYRLGLAAAAALTLAGAGSALGVPNAPSVSNPGGLNGFTNDDTPTLSITSNGGVGASGTFEWRIDGGSYVPVPVNLTLPALGEGSHTVDVVEVGIVPEPNSAPTSVTFSVDTIAPVFSRVVTPGAPTSTGWYRVPVDVDYTCTESGSGLAAPCPADAVGLPDGVYPLATGPVSDNAGNPSNALPALEVRIDTTAPAAPVGATPAGYTNILRPVFTWSAVEDAAGSGFGSYQLFINTSRTTAGATRVDDIPQGAGAQVTHTLQQDLVDNTTYFWAVRTVDVAGNTGALSEWVEVRVDTSAPDAPVIAAGPKDGAATNDNTPTFTINGVGGATYTWQTLHSSGNPVGLPGANASGAGPEITLPALPDDTYTFKVNQTAPNGRTSDFAMAQFTVDSAPPGRPGITGRPGTSANTRPSFTWSPGEQGGSFTWEVFGVGGARVQGPAATEDTTLQLPKALKAGSYTFRVRQTDRAGNTGDWSFPEPFTITAAQSNNNAAAVARRFRAVTRNAHRLAPKVGRGVWRSRTVLRWRRARGASLYNVQIFLVRGSRYVKVHSVFPRGTKVRIPARKIKPGKRYVWRVWPYMGSKRRYSRAPLGISWFKVRVPPKQARTAAAKK